MKIAIWDDVRPAMGAAMTLEDKKTAATLRKAERKALELATLLFNRPELSTLRFDLWPSESRRRLVETIERAADDIEAVAERAEEEGESTLNSKLFNFSIMLDRAVMALKNLTGYCHHPCHTQADGGQPQGKKKRKHKRNRKSKIAELLPALFEQDWRNRGKHRDELAGILHCAPSSITRAFAHKTLGPALNDMILAYRLKPDGIEKV
jgi:hypothetical protein